MRCLVCNQNITKNEEYLLNYFISSEIPSENALKFLSIIKRSETLFCNGCINLGLYLDDNDKGRLANRIKIILRRYYFLSSSTTSHTKSR